MGQGYRIEQYEQVQRLLEQYQIANEAAHVDSSAPARDPALRRVSDDGLELRSTRQGSQAVTENRRSVDVEAQRTRNLELGRITPEAFGQSQNGKHPIVVKAEAQSTHYDGAPARPEPSELGGVAGSLRRLWAERRKRRQARRRSRDRVDAPMWEQTEEALEEAVDVLEEFHYASQSPTTTGVVEAVQRASGGDSSAETSAVGEGSDAGASSRDAMMSAPAARRAPSTPSEAGSSGASGPSGHRSTRQPLSKASFQSAPKSTFKPAPMAARQGPEAAVLATADAASPSSSPTATTATTAGAAPGAAGSPTTTSAGAPASPIAPAVVSRAEATVIAAAPERAAAAASTAAKSKTSARAPVSRQSLTEATSAAFVYPQGGAFTELAKGATTTSGKGKTYVGPEPTRTHIKIKA